MAPTKYQPLTLSPINFSLTEGTSIPAPLDSPPDTPRPPTPGRGPLDSHPHSPAPADLSSDSTAPSTTFPLSPPVHEQLAKTTTSDGASSTLSPSLSPTLSKRPSSVRKFLGLRSLSSPDSIKSDTRPGSPATVDSSPPLKRKKSASWFGKRRQSTMFIGKVDEGGQMNSPVNATVPSHHQSPKIEEKKGPPPPSLPGMKTFGVSETSSIFGDDMFQNIK